MHRFSSSALLLSLLNSYLSEARPAPQADPAPCSTIVNLPEATLTISPGPSNAVVNGFPNGATSTIEANGPAITIGPNLLSLNAENNVNLNGFVFLFSDNFCPAVVIPITTLPSSSESTAFVPVPAPTDTPDDNPEEPPTDPEPVPDPSPPENPDTPVDPPEDPPEDPPSEDPNLPVIPIPIPSPVDPIPVPDPNPVDPVPNPIDPVPDPVDPVPDPVNPVPDPVDPVPEPVIPVPDPDPVDPVPDPVDPVPDPIDPVDPTITPPSPPPPNNEDPNECETQTANVCTQGCSFGTNSLGATTTTSCKDPTCTATTACDVSDTTSTTTIEPSACSLDGVASGYPFPVDGNGPLPRADAATTAPAPADPQPTPSEPESPPSEPEAPPSEPETPPSEPSAPAPVPPEAPEPSNQIFEAGKLTAGDGTESIVIYSYARDSFLNICNATPFYKESTLVGLSKKFDIPDSDYKNCDFVGIGSEPLGIYCEGKERLPCVVIEGSQLGSCLAGNDDVFGVTWRCNE